MKQILKITLILFCIGLITQCSESDDPKVTLPTLSINDAAGEEGGPAVFTVSLSELSTEDVTFKYSTSHTTTTDADFAAAANETATIAAGELTVEIVIDLTADASSESSETFKVVLSAPENAELSNDVEGTGTVNNKAEVYFMSVKIDGHQWTATFASDFFSPTFIDFSFAGYGSGVDFDSQLSFIFFEAPTGPKTFGIEVLGASDNSHVSVYYSPNFFSNSISGPIFNAQPGGQVVLTKYDVQNAVAEGTFSFTAKNPSNNQTRVFTEGQFKIKID
jgi:hypothetical protein